MPLDWPGSSGNFARIADGDAPVTGPPFTMACWFNPDTDNNYKCLMFLGDASENLQSYVLYLSTDAQVEAWTYDSSTVRAEVGTYSANSWQHAAGVWGGSGGTNDSRIAYYNGTASSEETTSMTPTGIDRFTLGRFDRFQSPTLYMDGEIYVPTIWGVELDADEIAELANGAHPETVRPDEIVWHASLLEDDAGLVDLYGGRDLTITGSLPVTEEGEALSHGIRSGIRFPPVAVAAPTFPAALRRRREFPQLRM